MAGILLISHIQAVQAVGSKIKAVLMLYGVMACIADSAPPSEKSIFLKKFSSKHPLVFGYFSQNAMYYDMVKRFLC